MKIAYLMPCLIIRDDKSYLVNSFVPKQIAGLKSFFPEIDFISFFGEAKRTEEGFQTLPDNIFQVKGLPFIKDGRELYFTKFYSTVVRLINIFMTNVNEWKAIILYEGSMPCQLAFLLSKIYHVPIYLWIGGYASRSIDIRMRYSSFLKKTSRKILNYEMNLALRRMAARADGLIVAGENLKHYFLELNPNVYCFTATGAHLEDIEKDLPYQRLDRGGPVRILTVGRLTPAKGLEYLIAAVSWLRRQGIEVEAKIVGPSHEPDYVAMLRALIEEADLSGKIIFSGEVQHGPDLFELYREADIFVLSSLTEATPKVLPEAMAKGLPVVATRVGSIPDQVKDGINGYLVAPGDAEELGKALYKLVIDRKLCFEMGKSSLETAALNTIEYQIGGVGQWIKDRIFQESSRVSN